MESLTYDPTDLRGQRARVLAFMLGSSWTLPEELAQHVPGSESALTSRLRELRKPEYGGYEVSCRPRKGRGRLCEYLVREKTNPLLTDEERDLLFLAESVANQ